MRRILVLGCAGAGKSTLARRLAAALALPVVELDRMFWRPGWVEAPREEFRDAVARVAAMPNWIMDGNYTFTFDLRLPLADTVVLLDLPRHICMWRVIMRTARGYGRTRAGLAEDCPERFDWEFLNYVWNFRTAHRPKIAMALAQYANNASLHRLESPQMVKRFLAMIERR
jgi:adenylate kinase family enzyme